MLLVLSISCILAATDNLAAATALKVDDDRSSSGNNKVGSRPLDEICANEVAAEILFDATGVVGVSFVMKIPRLANAARASST